MKLYLTKEFWIKNSQFILILILLLSLLLRVLYLETSSMWIDETISANAIKGIIENGYPILESGDKYTRGLFFHYLTAFFLIFSKSDFLIRFASVIFGVLTVYLAYLFGKKFLKTTENGLIFAFLIAISSIEIFYSKQVRFYQLFQFLYFFSFYLFYKFIILKETYFEKKYLDYLSLIIVILLAIDTQTMGYLIIPLFSIIYYIHFIKFNNIKDFKESILKKDILIIFILNFLFLIWLFILFGSLINYDKIPNFSGQIISYIELYIILFPILILSIIGMIIALYKDFKFNFSLILFSIIPVIGIVFMKYFATRYIYFSFFVLFFYLTYLISHTRLKYFILLILLIFYQASVFDLNGIKEPNYDQTMPYADYKNAYKYILVNYNEKSINITSSWPAAAMWYLEKSDYWIYFSIDGQESNKWQIASNGNEIFSNSTIVYSISEFPKNTLVILEVKNKPKINQTMVNFIENKCDLTKTFDNLEIYYCN